MFLIQFTVGLKAFKGLYHLNVNYIVNFTSIENNLIPLCVDACVETYPTKCLCT